MDSISIAIIFIVISILVITYFSYQVVQYFKLQNELIVAQNMSLRSQIDPILSIRGCSFNLNSLDITIENIGTGLASSLAVETSFLPTKRIFYENEDSLKPLSEFELLERGKTMKQVSIKYEIEEKNIELNGNSNSPRRISYLLLNRPRNSLLLFPKETCSYHIELGFGLITKHSGELFYPKYSEFINVLKKNKITCFILSFKLLCKNMLEDQIPDQNIATFIVDLTRHSTIEEAYKENTTPSMTVGYLFLATNGIPIDSTLYKNSKTNI